MVNFRTLDDVDLAGKRVLVRADLNMPLNNGTVSDTTRIERTFFTIKDITAAGGKVILISHFGRPGGQPDPALSLAQMTPVVERTIGGPVIFVPTDWNDLSGAQKAIADAPEGAVLLLENTRFHPGEMTNDIELARRMAALGDLYVNDAFSAAHRAHASTEALAHLLPAFAGRAMQGEIRALSAGLTNPQKPVIALVGGAKVSTKIELLENLIERVEALVIGGAMANTFLFSQGIGVGNSVVEKDLAPVARRIFDKASDANCAIILPVDGQIAWRFEAEAPHRTYGIEAIDPNGMILDVGPKSIERIKGAIDEAETLVWNGPLGAFELSPFDAGTLAIARYVAERTRAGKLVSIAGGGDTVAALTKAGVRDDLTYVSTAGGAFLEWMEGKPLPGLKALRRD
ncbi:MAG: phosphoglycerate kinase [Alphaproteobacteria bacterium]|nr:phosphoglycerate kinase [Alphaproteobacteria bacterium]